MDVIPLILSERDVAALSDEILSMLAECSTDCIQVKICNYLKDEKRDEATAHRIAEAYSNVIRLKEYLQDEQLKESVENIKNLTYEDISPSLSIEQLTEYKENIQGILDSEYAVPYLKPVRSSLLKELLSAMEASGSDAKRIAERIHKFSYLFRDPPSASYKGTVVKKIVRERTKYEVLVRGIQYLIGRKAKDMFPSQWRVL